MLNLKFHYLSGWWWGRGGGGVGVGVQVGGMWGETKVISVKVMLELLKGLNSQNYEFISNFYNF
jgi:hypothetical protein